jgi:hypothetical protein
VFVISKEIVSAIIAYMQLWLGEDIDLDPFVDAGFDEYALSDISVGKSSLAFCMGLAEDDIDWDICMNYGPCQVVLEVSPESGEITDIRFFDTEDPKNPKELTVYDLPAYCGM